MVYLHKTYKVHICTCILPLSCPFANILPSGLKRQTLTGTCFSSMPGATSFKISNVILLIIVVPLKLRG